MEIEFQPVDWSLIETTQHKGETGTAFWKTLQFDGLLFLNAKAQEYLTCRKINSCIHVNGIGKGSVRFSYTVLPEGNMLIKGYWRSKNTIIQLEKLSIDSLNLEKVMFLFMQEDQ